MVRMRLSLTGLALLATAALAAPPAIDWPKVNQETFEHFSNVLMMDTSNPPGNETKVARYLKTVLEREGIKADLFAADPARANLVARIKGNGSKKPLLIMGHTDVVGVQREKWAFDPFAVIRKDGFVYARGANDDKDSVAAGLMIMLMLKRNNVELDRDVIFLAEAGEERSTSIGVDYMIKEHWSEIEAEFALAEGGGGQRRDGKTRYVSIATTEKVPRGARLVAKGSAGHGSVPRMDNALIHLANAVAKVGEWQTPMRLNDTTRAYFERLATISTPAEAARYNALFNAGKAPAVDLYLRRKEGGHYSQLRTSVVPTIMKAGFQSNVIPSEAEATLDVRMLPDEDPDKFYADMARVIGDPNVTIVPNRSGRPFGRPSGLDTAMFRALEAAQRKIYPEAITLPNMMTGATDMSQLRAKGIPAYGTGAIIDEKNTGSGGAHSDDERIEEVALYKYVEFLWTAVINVAAKQ